MKMRLLELFSGTGSVGDVFREHGWSVLSLDRDMPADIQVDIMAWDYREFQPHTFDFVWCSPPCTEYSIAKTVGTRRIDEANAIVRRTLEIVRYFDPPCWAIENPQSGHLKRQEFMAELPYHDLDYCRYGMPYRKRTRLWGVLGGVGAETAMQVGLSICRRRAAPLHGAAAVERWYAAQVVRSLSRAQSAY